MKAFIKVAQSSAQGKPLYGLPHRDIPSKIAPLKEGAVFEGKTMADTVSLLAGMETFSEKHAVRWSEGSPLAAQSDYHGYGGTAAPHATVPGLMFTAQDLGRGLVGAQRLHQLLDWLTLLTKPWSRLHQPPLLYVQVGRRWFYGYLEGFDPEIQEFMPDGGDAEGLPRTASFPLGFLVEPLGLDALKKRVDTLPKSVGLKGGAGGFLTPAQTQGSALSAAGQQINGQNPFGVKFKPSLTLPGLK